MNLKDYGKYVAKRDGAIFHYYHGLLHRIDGPAAEWPNGYKYWYFKGKLHRSDGPAVELPSGYKEYWVNGIRQ